MSADRIGVPAQDGNMSLLLIDDQGKVWPGESRQLRVAFDSPFSGGEFVEYAVKNLGFVAINNYGRSCQVRLRPSFVAVRAVHALASWLERARVERAVLTTFDKSWCDEFVPGSNLQPRIEGLLSDGASGRPEDFLARSLPPSAIEGSGMLADIVRGWPHLTQNYDVQTLIRLLRAAFDGRFVIVRREKGNDRVLFREFGERMFPQYDTWRTCAIGAPIEEQPERA
ncbi:MAG: hypothetical protein JSS20_15285, partial [Proteobacteria bacterium]|nr:hypothetical protein [Pseudomonadota bacterium]